MLNHTRRTLLKGGTGLAILSSMSGFSASLVAQLTPELRRRYADADPLIEEPEIDVLCDTALAAARAAGAQYADIRLTHTFTRLFSSRVSERESMTVGVRTLVDGYWGFASSPLWTQPEMVRLAQTAVENAKANILGRPRDIMLAPVTPVVHGEWTTPIKDDPFVTSEDEIFDFINGVLGFIRKLPYIKSLMANAAFMKQDKMFASTEGHSVRQRFYQTQGSASFGLGKDGRSKSVSIDTMTPAGLGFEYLRDQPLREEIVARHQEALRDMELPLKPVDVGRYALVFDAPSAAQLVSATIGLATELDRAMGYEANANGTSYITDPATMLGTLKIGAPLLNVTANRTEAAGAATVKWDDEGVVPGEFPLVKDGILTDMQTNREGAGWLEQSYATQGRPLASHGCAYTLEAILTPLTHCANLRLEPAARDLTFESLISDMSDGLAIKRADIDMDFQQVTGYGGGETFEIKNGKRVAEIQGAAFLFRTPELWNSLTAIGGAASARRFGVRTVKGEPRQSGVHSVTAPPVAIKELSVIDPTRKA